MKNFILKIFLYLYIIISKFSITRNETFNKENCKDEKCLKITIYNNGTIDKECVVDEDYIKKDIRTSIALKNTLIIFDCAKKNSTNYNKCQYNLNDGTNNLDVNQCKDNGTSDEKNNECCYFKEKYNNNDGCIEVNKYEYERFKWNGIIRDNFSNINNDSTEKIGYIECNSNISKINILILINLLIFYLI